jgi:hypothetical protein
MGASASMARKALIAGICASAIATLAFGAEGKVDYTGSWKGNCEDPFGLQIKPLRNGLYSISFCKREFCSPKAYRPDTRIENDPLYEVLSPTKFRLKHSEGGYSTYVKCSSEAKPSSRSR